MVTVGNQSSHSDVYCGARLTFLCDNGYEQEVKGSYLMGYDGRVYKGLLEISELNRNMKINLLIAVWLEILIFLRKVSIGQDQGHHLDSLTDQIILLNNCQSGRMKGKEQMIC